ncbi:MAG: DUF3093 domain-containing protein [Candidatus Nanopelagicales bacterium]
MTHNPATAPTPRRVGSEIGYSERLWPGPWAWAFGGGLVAALGVAYTSAVSSGAGWLVLLVAGSGALLALLRHSPRITVTADTLGAGPARLPLELTGRVIALDAAASREARGPRGDPTAFVLTGLGAGSGAVVVEVCDPADPHGTWLVSTRRPERLARAITMARGRL